MPERGLGNAKTPGKCRAFGFVLSVEQWERRDSNPRRQSHLIYSQTRLTTSVHSRIARHESPFGKPLRAVGILGSAPPVDK